MLRWAALASAFLGVGCGRSVLVFGDGGREPAGDDCPSGVRLGGTCVGVTVEGRCHDGPWLEKMSCDEVVTVSDDGALSAALAQASAGECIDLVEGSYGSHTVPPGVSLVGRGWDCVSLGTVVAASGVIRGVAARGVAVEAVDVTLDEVLLDGASEDGVRLAAGATATLRHVSILDPGAYGVAAFDSGDLTLDAVLIDGSTGPGLWVQCGDSFGQCASARTPLSMRRSQIRAARVVGLSLVNAQAVIEDVVIRDTTVGNNFEAGGNLSVASSSLEAEGLTILDATDFGILVHDGEVTLGAADGDAAVEVSGNLRGLWVQGVGSDVAVTGAAFSSNLGVSIGVDNGATLAVERATIRDTVAINLPVLVNGVSAGSVEVADGVAWGGGATATLSQLSVGGSERVPILINGSVGAGSALDHIELVGGDAEVGIVHQNLYPGAILPTLGPDVPAPTSTSEELYPVPGL